jgi:hypothetical protein
VQHLVGAKFILQPWLNLTAMCTLGGARKKEV